MSLLNQYSFFAIMGALGVVLAGGLWLMLRNTPRKRLLLAIIMALYAVGVLLFNFSQQVQTQITLEDVDAALSSQRPTFVMLYSNY
jgi:hypothetical protein